MAVTFTNYVGVSPATTTMQLSGLGVCPPGHYGPAVMLPGAVNLPAAAGPQAQVTVNPYGTESKLSGCVGCSLKGPSGVRWDLTLLGFGLAFAGMLGYAFYRVRRTKLLGVRGARGLRGEEKTARVYFAENGQMRRVQVTPEVWRKLRELKKTDGVYYATTRNDYLTLRPYVRDED